MSDLEDMVAAVAEDHYARFYPLCRRPDLFVEGARKILHQPGLLADAYAAANNCEGVAVGQQSEWQRALWQALRGLYLQKSRPHPLRMQKAEAFASTVSAAFTLSAEAEIIRHIGEVGAMRPDEYEAREREDEIERLRPKPPRRPLYPV
jgi:hypothetical protein